MYLPKELCFARGRGSDGGGEKDRCPSQGETQVEPGEPPLPTCCMPHVRGRWRPRDMGIGLRNSDAFGQMIRFSVSFPHL